MGGWAWDGRGGCYVSTWGLWRSLEVSPGLRGPEMEVQSLRDVLLRRLTAEKRRAVLRRGNNRENLAPCLQPATKAAF